jgi:hypothetical protein
MRHRKRNAAAFVIQRAWRHFRERGVRRMTGMTVSLIIGGMSKGKLTRTDALRPLSCACAGGPEEGHLRKPRPQRQRVSATILQGLPVGLGWQVSAATFYLF